MDFTDRTILTICFFLLTIVIVIYLIFQRYQPLEESMVPDYKEDYFMKEDTSLPNSSSSSSSQSCCNDNQVYASATGKDQFFNGFDTNEVTSLAPFTPIDGGIDGKGKSYFSSFPEEIKCDPSADYVVPMSSMCMHENKDGNCPKKQKLVCGLTPRNLRRCHWE